MFPILSLFPSSIEEIPSHVDSLFSAAFSLSPSASLLSGLQGLWSGGVCVCICYYARGGLIKPQARTTCCSTAEPSVGLGGSVCMCVCVHALANAHLFAGVCTCLFIIAVHFVYIEITFLWTRTNLSFLSGRRWDWPYSSIISCDFFFLRDSNDIDNWSWPLIHSIQLCLIYVFQM